MVSRQVAEPLARSASCTLKRISLQAHLLAACKQGFSHATITIRFVSERQVVLFDRKESKQLAFARREQHATAMAAHASA